MTRDTKHEFAAPSNQEGRQYEQNHYEPGIQRSTQLAYTRAATCGWGQIYQKCADLAHESCIKQAQSIIGKIDKISAEDLEKASHSAHSVYVHTYPRSDLSSLDYKQQAEHFVAEACVHCLSPTYYDAKKHHLAERVSTYCIMARTCASVDHEGDYPKFTESEDLVKREINDQYEILSKYLDSI